jgi:hypothetical protein
MMKMSLLHILDHHKRYNAKTQHTTRKNPPENVSARESFFPQSELFNKTSIKSILLKSFEIDFVTTTFGTK